MTRLFVMKCLRYESAITRFFMRGRTETLRPLSEHSCAFVKAMDNPGASAATKVGGCVSYPWCLVRVASSRQHTWLSDGVASQGYAVPPVIPQAVHHGPRH